MVALRFWALTRRGRARAGKHHLAYHRDKDAKVYGDAPVIASVSFGCERDFELRKCKATDEKYVFALGGGAALLMHGANCQKTWEHGVPARAGAPPGGRINLTFRYRIPGAA